MFGFKERRALGPGPRDAAFRLETLNLIADLELLRYKSESIPDGSLETLRQKLAALHSDLRKLIKQEGLRY